MMTINLQAAYDQARHFLETNDTERAIAVAQHILSSFPDNLEAHLILGEAHVAIRQFETAQKFLQRVIAADPENIPAHVGLGIIYERLGKAPQAVAEFEQALEIKPDMPELRSQLLRLYTDAWGPEGAQLRLSRAGLARLYAKGHMLLQAIQEFRSVIADHPDRFDARVGLAEVLWRDGQDSNAQAICKEILAERKDVLKANIILGYIKLATGDSEGERYWRVAQELDPYQNVAQAMFEVLPNTVEAKTTLPAWDEAAWSEQVAREARKQEEEAAAKALAALPPPPQEAPPSTVSHPADEFDFSFGVPETPSLPKQPLAIPDEAFLASLLQVNVAGATQHSSPHEPEDLLTDLELSPFSFDDFGDAAEHAPPRAAALASQPSAPSKPSSPEPVTPPPPEVAEPDMRPFSLEELGLTEEEIKSFTEPSTSPVPSPSASKEKGNAESAFEEDFGMTPFSFDDFDLAAEEASPPTHHDSPPAKGSSPSLPVGDKSGSLPDDGRTKKAAQVDSGFEEDFGMAAFSFDDFEQPSNKQMPSSAPAVSKGKPASQPRGDMPASFGMGFGQEPFSDDEDLDLGKEDFTLPSTPKMAEPASTPAPASKVIPSSKPSFNDASDEDLGFEPFSLEDISLHEEANRVVPVIGRSDDDLPTAEAFDWSQQDAEPSPKEPSKVAEDYGFDSDESIDDLQPFAFSLDDLDLEESKSIDVGSRSLPPSLQPFSLEESSDLPNLASLRPARPNAPLPEDDEISTDRGAFSWQLPASKPGTDFLHGNAPKDQQKGSIFAKLQKQREELVLEEVEEVTLPTLNEEDEEVSFFSDDDVHLWDEEQQVVPDQVSSSDLAASPLQAEEAELDLTPSSFNVPASKLPASKDLSPAPNLSSLSPKKEEDYEPELIPFTLEDLGLTPEEIESLSTGSISQGSDAKASQPEPTENDELDFTPFSLDDLGLSEENLDLFSPPPETKKPSSSKPISSPSSLPKAFADEPALDPFSAETFDLSYPDSAPSVSPKEEEPSTSELEPFSFDNFGLDELEITSPPPPASAKVQAQSKEEEKPSALELEPFSFDDFGLGELETTLPLSPPSDKPRIQTKSQPTLRVKSQPKPPVDLSADLVDSEDDEGSLTPFSFADFGLSEAQPEPPPPAKNRMPGTGTIARDTVRLEAGVEPFSIDDLGLNFSAEVLNPEDENDSARLGLTTDELAGMDLGQFEEHTKPQTRALSDDLLSTINHSSPSNDMALDQLLELGQKQGFVDLTDIINIFEDPVAESERIEDIGRALYRAGIQIRDGDEIIPMDDDETYIEDFDALESQVASVNQSDIVTPIVPTDKEPELTPFSLQELGLTAEEIAALNNAEDLSASAAPVSSAPAPEAEPELTPFSLQELGLTDEEIATLNAANAEDYFPAPAAASLTAVAPKPEAEPELTPFSLQDLGLTDEEIATLNAANAEDFSLPSPVPPLPELAKSPEAEPELTPFSLQDLGLTDEEIAALNTASSAEDFSVSSTPPVSTPEAEPELTPFSLQELGLTEEEIAALNAASSAEDFSVSSTPPVPTPEAEPELTPFSLQELGLTEEEITALNAASANAASFPANEPKATAKSPIQPEKPSDDEITPFDLEAFCQAETESAALKQANKQQQGRPNSKRPHHVSISLADLGLTEEVRNALIGTEGSSSQTSPQASYSSQPIQPISPESLGLSADAVAALGLLAKGGKDSAATILIPNAANQSFPQPLKPDTRAQTTPPELIEDRQVDPLPNPTSSTGTEMEADWFNFEFSEAQPQKTPQSSPVPSSANKGQVLSPEDAAFVPADLDTLDDIWPPETFAPKAASASPSAPTPGVKSSPSPAARSSTPLPARQPAVEPARPVSWPPQQQLANKASPLALEGLSSERSDARPTPPLRRSSSSRLSSSQAEAIRPGRVNRSRGSAPQQPTSPSRGEIRATPPLRGEAFSPTRSARGGRDASRVARPRRSDAYRSNVGTAPEAFIPTGSTELDEYLHQLELEPGNWQLRLAIARIGIQTNRLDLAIHHYKRLIKDDRSGDQVIIDLQESIDETDDQYLLQRLYRLLGDAYAQQDRYREAVAAYGCVFQR